MHYNNLIPCITAGTAILSKIEPISVTKTLPGHPDPNSVKGRIITLEFESCYVVGTYVVNAGTALKVIYFFQDWVIPILTFSLVRQWTRKKSGTHTLKTIFETWIRKNR
jgi:exonuclease III